MFWGILGGLTWGFRDKRPWEGWWGAFTRACNVMALFYVVVIAVGIGVFAYEHFIGHPRAEAKSAEWHACLEKNYLQVRYDGSTIAYAPSYHPLCLSPDGGYGCTPPGYISDWDRQHPTKPCPAE